MWMCLVFIFVVVTAQQLNRNNHFVKTPVSKEPADAIIHTGGRLVVRHLEYLITAGYKSVISLGNFSSNDTVFNGVEGQFPSSSYEEYLVSAAGLSIKHFDLNLTDKNVRYISDVISVLPKPLYVHCYSGWSASLVVLLHYYLTSDSITSSQSIYSSGIAMGYDYKASEVSVNLINALTGSADIVQPPCIEFNLKQGEDSYKSYYWPHRVGSSDNWYSIGQILFNHSIAIADAGYKSVLSFRVSGEATVRLPSDPSTGPVQNDEFSDEYGNYQSSLEKVAMEKAGLVYVNLPLPGGDEKDWTVDQFLKFYPIMKSLEENHSPVLAHCASGHRSIVYTLAYLGYNQDEHICADWAINRAKEVGFNFNGSNPSVADVQVVSFFSELFGC